MTYRQVSSRYNGHKPQASAGRRRGRMSVSGVNVLDENGNPWVMRGFVYGEVSLWNAVDSAEDAAMGANTARIMVRAWGGGSYTAPNLDGESVGLWGDTDQTYLANVEAQVVAAKRAGLKVILAFDSNCGQNGNQSLDMAAFCDLDASGVGDNFGTAAGATKRAQHKNRMRIFIRKLYGLVDFVEPLVEPNWGTTGGTQADVNAFYVEMMNAVMLEDPDIIFIVGGFSYQHGKVQDPFQQGTFWPTTNLVGTCDLLDNIMSDQASGNYAAAVGDITFGRNKQGVPMVVQQAGTQFTSEVGAVGSATDSLLLASGLEALRTASGGSIGWTCWEKVSKGSNQYGGWWDSTGIGANRRLASQNRVDTMKAAFKAAPIYPS